jgi:hypothetical protein
VNVFNRPGARFNLESLHRSRRNDWQPVASNLPDSFVGDVQSGQPAFRA